MHTSKKLAGVIAFTVLLFSCNQRREADTKSKADSLSETSGNSFSSSLAAVENGKDTSHKFVRTAEMKFRVKNVYEATNRIEDIASKLGGFVTLSDLQSDESNTIVTPVSADSSLETINYKVTNTIILRVPNTRLDSTLKSISGLIDYLDFRRIKADDVKLLLIANKYTQERMKKPNSKFSSVLRNNGEELIQHSENTENILYNQKQSDEANLSTLSLQDKISYSTLNLSIYQRQEAKRWIIANDKNIEAYKPGFGIQLVESLSTGWKMLESFLVFITKFWGIILLGSIIYLLYRKLKFKAKAVV